VNNVQHASTTKPTRLIDLLRSAGDASLGDGLLRLAQLAAAMHRHEAARHAAAQAEQHREVGANGLARSTSVADDSATGPGTQHTEVLR
jgi:hypothetical protein